MISKEQFDWAQHQARESRVEAGGRQLSCGRHVAVLPAKIEANSAARQRPPSRASNRRMSASTRRASAARHASLQVGTKWRAASKPKAPWNASSR